MKNIVLPSKLSELMELAYNDALLSVAQGHTINMGNWLVPMGDGKCSVCLAGAVMLQTLDFTVEHEEAMPYDDPKNRQKLHWINDMRIGDFFMSDKELELKKKYDDLYINSLALDPKWPEMIAYMRGLGV